MSGTRWTRRRFLAGTVAGGVVASVAPDLGGQLLAAEPFVEEAGAIGWSLKVTGDAQRGFATELWWKGRRITEGVGGGEFSALFKNEERSVADQLESWRATSQSGDAKRVTLRGPCVLKNLNATVMAQVEYEVVTPNVVRKRIRLEQADMFLMFHSLTNRLEVPEAPAKFWSFDQTDWVGEAAHEYFPAGGFRTTDGLCVGLLTDAGFRNQWTRLIRRDGKPVKPAPERVPDARLYTASGKHEGEPGTFFVQQQFGELLERVPAQEPQKGVALPELPSWKTLGEAKFAASEGVGTISREVRKPAWSCRSPRTVAKSIRSTQSIARKCL